MENQNQAAFCKEQERIDDLQISNLKIIQDPKRFCFGMDAVVLSGFLKAKRGARVLDMGTGTGILPLLTSAKTDCATIVGLEIQHESADMAGRSVLLNGLEERIQICEGDLKEAAKIFGKASFDVVTCNPPYMPVSQGEVNPGSAKAIARHELFCTLEDVVKSASEVLVSGGHFFMVHRPFRLPEIIREMSRMGLEPKRMRLVHPYVTQEPQMILVEGVKGAGIGMTVEPPLILYDAPNVYSAEMREKFGF